MTSSAAVDQTSVAGSAALVDRTSVGGSATSYGSRQDLFRRGTRDSRVSNKQANRSGTQMYQPGLPIGYLAARGTVFEKKYFTKKLGKCCLFLAPPILAIVGVLTLVPILYGIALHALHTAQLHIIEANLTSITNTSFPLTITGQVTKTGIFPARLLFRKPVDVYWNTPRPNMKEVHLGHFDLGFIDAAAGHAKVNQATMFHIDDVEAFGIFAEWLVTKPQFTWKVNCSKVHAEGFSFYPVYRSLVFQKDVIINGLNNFENVKILDLQLPGNDPAGGIQAIATASLFNPSPFGVEVGTLNLELFYKDLLIGPVQGTGINLTAGLNTITLFGRVIPYTENQTALELLGELFTNYINSVSSPVIAKGVSTQQVNGDVIGWLNQGIRALTTTIPFIPPTPIDPIKGIVINYFSLVYFQDLPFNPNVFSNSLTGTFALPFGFSLNITDLSAQLNIYNKGGLVGTASGPYGNSSTDISLLTTGETAGTIHLNLPPTQFVLPNTTDAAKIQLIEFQNAFTYAESADFVAQGFAKAITDTPIGRILLNGIKFNITTGLMGLNGLTTYPTIINSVDVTGGAIDAVELVVDLTVINPSNINISAGDATFNLINQVPLGNATLPGLVLVPGRNDINSTALFDPNRSPFGIETLNRFISGLDTFVNVSGFNESSKIESLTPTLSMIRLNSTLPGLKQNLAQSANLTVLNTTAILDDLANSHVQLYNPFSSTITITRLNANASSHGIYIANINTQLVFPAIGKSITTSPLIPLTLNTYPPDLFAVLRALVIESNQNPAYLDGLVEIAGYTLSPTTDANSKRRKRELQDVDDEEEEEEDEMTQILMGVGSNPGTFVLEHNEDELDLESESESDGVARLARSLTYEGVTKRDPNLYTGFDITTYVGNAFKVATADLEIISDAIIGEYGTTLTFTQNDVPLGTDETLFLLLPPLALPIVQKVVDGAVLNVDRVTILESNPTTFTAALQGALTNAGPFDGVVSFPQGLDIFWEGQLLASAAFPDLALVGDLGSAINVIVSGSIPDVAYFTKFLQYAILNPSFLWNIRATGIQVAALGIIVTNVTINKDVQLAGLNGLAGNVIINSFDVPSNAPGGGLTLTAIASIYNPAQVGVSLSRFGTNIMLGDIAIGPAASAAPFTLQALAVTTLPLAGVISAQDSDAGLAALSNIFTRFVHNQNTDVLVNGVYAGDADVAWLNDGIKVLAVTVSLPSQDFQVIREVSINQLSLYFTVSTAWSPPSDTNNITANFFLPFSLPVNIETVAGPFIANYRQSQMAVLHIPTSKTLTNVEARVLTLMFQNVPFSVYDDAHSDFSQFVADVTAKKQVTANLNGMATGTASTGAGVITITDIPFNLNTNILGLQNLNAQPAIVTDLDVAAGYPTYLKVTVMVQLFNPSDITIGAGDISFAALFQNNLIGAAVINDVLLVPGINHIPTQINYMPVGTTNVASGQLLLENYVQNVTSDATVAGTDQTTPIPSLIQGLGGITLTAAIPPLEKLIVIEAFLEVPDNIAQTGVAMASVQVANPFTATISIINLKAQAIYQGITIGNIDLDLTTDPIVSPGKVTTQSRQVPINIVLDPKVLIRFILAAAATAGVSLGPLPPFFQQVLDLDSTVTTISPFPDPTAPPYAPSCDSGRAFDSLGAILALLKPLVASIPIQSTVLIDEYQTNLDFIQQPVPVGTDRSALNLVGPAGAPLIQLIVNEATLTVTQANATSITDSGFTAALMGSLLTDAPADAIIEFLDPVLINFKGVDIAEISLPPLCSSPPNGIPNLLTTGQLTILDQTAFSNFAYYLLTQPRFSWFLHSKTVRVRALGIAFSNVILEKTITLDAFNGLPNLVITKFNAPSDAPDRINLAATVPIPSPAQLGVELGMATFEAYFAGSSIGFISSSGLFLAAQATTITPLTGYLTSQANNPTGLANVGVLFSQFLSGHNSTLVAHGVDVITPASNGKPVTWLSNAFSRFSTNVILPGHIYQIIYTITLSDLTVTIENQANSYLIPASNNNTLAMFSNPFGFHLQPLEAAPLITLTYQGVPTAQLDLPLLKVQAGTSTGPTDMQPLQLSFKDQDITSLNDGSFQAFLAKLADTSSADFGLQGSTSVVAKTNIGNPTITGIPFNVTSSLLGVNSFNRKAGVSDVSVDDPTPNYIGIHLVATLYNPSNLTLFTNQLSLPTLYTTRNVVIGRATIPKLGLIPGSNIVDVLFEFIIPEHPFNSSDVQEVLQLYLQPNDFMTAGQNNTIPLQINGAASGTNPSPALSPYDSLEPALEGVIANAVLQGLATDIALHVDVYIPLTVIADEIKSVGCAVLEAIPILAGLLGSLCPTNATTGGTNSTTTGVYITAILTAHNEVPVQIDLKHISGSVSGYNFNNGLVYALFDFDFVGANSFNLDAATSTGNPSIASQKSPLITNILLTQGLIKSLPLIGHPLDVDLWIQTDVSGPGGSYFIPGLHYIQYNIPTSYYIGTPEANVPITSAGTLTSLLDALTGGLTDDLINLLGGFDPSNLSGIFAKATGVGNSVGAAFCSAVPILCPGGALTAPTALVTVSSSSTISLLTLNNITASSLSVPTTLPVTLPTTLPTSLPTSLSLPVSIPLVNKSPAVASSNPTSAKSSGGLLGGILRRSEPTPIADNTKGEQSQFNLFRKIIAARERGDI